MEKRIHDQGNDELAFLSDNIDSMVTEIQLLLEQRQQSEAKKRELELKMLQYQINPAFSVQHPEHAPPGGPDEPGQSRRRRHLFLERTFEKHADQ